MKSDELKVVLMNHAKWLEDKTSGKRANLSCADLRGADLSGADLSHADLRQADLREADLIDADLHCADLSAADLRGADLSGASGFPFNCCIFGAVVSLSLIYDYFVQFCILGVCEAEQSEFDAIKAVILPFAKRSEKAASLGVDKMSVGTGSLPGVHANGDDPI